MHATMQGEDAGAGLHRAGSRALRRVGRARSSGSRCHPGAAAPIGDHRGAVRGMLVPNWLLGCAPAAKPRPANAANTQSSSPALMLASMLYRPSGPK